MTRNVPILVALVIGAIVSIGGFVELRDDARAHHLDGIAFDGQKVLQKHLLSSYDLLQPLGSFFKASDFVRRDEFTAFTSPILATHPTIQALEWVPRVSLEQRAEYEKWAQDDGLAGFGFRERQGSGPMVPAQVRSQYFPVFYAEPRAGNEKALGFDLGSSPVRLAALIQAQNTGMAVTTSRITLVQGTKKQFGYLIFQPVYGGVDVPNSVEDRKRRLMGFALGVFKISDFVEQALREAGGEAEKLEAFIFDVTRPLASVNLHPRLEKDFSRRDLNKRWCVDSFISHGERKWQVTLCDSLENPVEFDSRQAWIVLLLGLSVTGILAIYLWTLSNQQTRTKTLIKQRTGELEEANKALEVKNRRLQEIDSALRSSEGRVKAVMDNVIDAIITIDHKGVVQSANLALKRVFGYEEEEIIGRNVSMLAPEPFRSAHDSYIESYHRTGIPKIINSTRELQAQRKDGSIFPMELAVSELEFQGEKLFIGLIRDITHRKEVEKIKSELVSTVSHELRTPLTSIRGSLGLLAGEAVGALPDSMKRLVELAQKNTDRLVTLVNDILDLEKLASGTMEFEFGECSLRGLVSGAINELSGYAEEQNVSFVFKDFYGDCAVMADPMRINQVLANLLSNAAKFSPDKGEVQVSLEEKGEFLRVNIADQGAGIPAEYRDSIFDRFSQVDSSDTRKKGGTGLGLSIAKSIIDHHNGRIDFRPGEDGVGTVFFFDIHRFSMDRRAKPSGRRKTER